MTESNDNQIRTWGMLAHLTSLVYLPLASLGLSFPVVNILGPLIIWLLKKKKHPFIDYQGKESLNFQISFALYFLVLIFILLICISISRRTLSVLVILLLIALLIAHFILVTMAALKAQKGDFYRYPLTIRFLR